MISEFIELTGFEPTAAEYRRIEDQYIEEDIDKKDFCKKWVEEGGVAKIAQERLKEIEDLKAQLTQAQNDLEMAHADMDEALDLIDRWKQSYNKARKDYLYLKNGISELISA